MATQPEEPRQGASEGSSRLYSLVVIGASAGGIEALATVLEGLPADFSVPVVVAQHLDPQYPSRLAEILAWRSALPIHTITDHAPLAPGAVYVAREACHVEISDRHLRLFPDELSRPMPSINRLLSSAAQVYGEHLIAVILTGTGSDGAAGAYEVKAAGGTVVIENPATAAYPAMPASLAPTTVDLVADLARIGPLLQALVSGTAVAALPALAPGAMTAEEKDEQQQHALQSILTLVRERSNIDFAHYKHPTILRRLQRRMAAVDVTDLPEYARYLAEHPDEPLQLAASFLIKVTEFFRDPEIFDVLRKEVLPDLIAQARTRGNVLRLWSAGCATGEEAYSLAILVAEALGEELDQFTVQLFATDVDMEALTFARRGIYTGAALAEVPEALRARYFVKLDGEYEVAKRVRGMIVFGPHDLGRQAPFPHVDLVLCRNVLIYFTKELQERALRLFAFALRLGGYLLLGHAETLHPLEEYFAPAHGQYKLYRRQGEAVLSHIVQSVDYANLVPPPRVPPTPQVPPAVPRQSLPPPTPQDATRLALAQAIRAPVGELGRGRSSDEWLGSVLLGLPIGVVVVDRHYDIQAINPIALRLLGIYTVPLGEDLIHLTQSIPSEDLRTPIDAAFQGKPTLEPGTEEGALAATGIAEAMVTVETVLGERRHLRITCYPYVRAPSTLDGAAPPRPGAATAVLILIEDISAAVAAQQQATAQVERERGDVAARQAYERGEQEHAFKRVLEENTRLKQEQEHVSAVNRTLLEANQNLTETVLDLRRSNDELLVEREEAQANAEEVKTLNEELQATNEEHVTVNEELQATIEELHVANDELQARSRELQLSADTLAAQRLASEAARARLEAILLSLGDAVLVLDQAGTPLLTNAAYTAMFGEPSVAFVAEDATGQPLPAEATPQQRAARGEHFTIEFTLPGEQGRLRWFEANGQPIRSAGTDLGGVLAIRDITERVLAIRDIAERDLQSKLQNEFMALASHELRTPLTPLTAYLDLLSRQFTDHPEDARARGYTERAQHQVRRLQRIVQDLLDVSRLQQGKFDLAVERMRLDELVAVAVEAAQMMTTDQTIHLERADTPLFVNGDPMRLEQVLMNLLANAITYAPQSPRIDVRVRRVGNEAEVQVQDYGEGIAAAELPRVFSRFYQGVRPQGDRPSRRGLGLGLYIAHEVVVAHGGQIEVASVEAPRDGHGTTFIIRVPLAPSGAADPPRKDRRRTQ